MFLFDQKKEFSILPFNHSLFFYLIRNSFSGYFNLSFCVSLFPSPVNLSLTNPKEMTFFFFLYFYLNFSIKKFPSKKTPKIKRASDHHNI